MAARRSVSWDVSPCPSLACSYSLSSSSESSLASWKISGSSIAVSFASPASSPIASGDAEYAKPWNPECNVLAAPIAPTQTPPRFRLSLLGESRPGLRCAHEVDGCSPIALGLDLQVDVEVRDRLELARPGQRADVDGPEADRAEQLGDFDACPIVVSGVQRVQGDTVSGRIGLDRSEQRVESLDDTRTGHPGGDVLGARQAALSGEAGTVRLQIGRAHV